MSKGYNRNILVFAENNGTSRGFNIYLDFSGQREYLLTHRHNGAIFKILENGIRLPDLERGIRDMNMQLLSGRRSRITLTNQLQKNLSFLLTVIDEYITDREQCA